MMSLRKLTLVIYAQIEDGVFKKYDVGSIVEVEEGRFEPIYVEFGGGSREPVEKWLDRFDGEEPCVNYMTADISDYLYHEFVSSDELYAEDAYLGDWETDDEASFMRLHDEITFENERIFTAVKIFSFVKNLTR